MSASLLGSRMVNTIHDVKPLKQPQDTIQIQGVKYHL